MKKTIYTILISGLLLGATLLPTKAFAECQPIYGGGQTCTSYSFSVQKLVETPGKGGQGYVNNLSINDPKYSPNQQVNFEIIVTNTDSQTIPAITVVDTFPQFVEFVSGPGSFNSDNKTLTFTINNLGAGQSKTYVVSGKIADANSLPTDQGIMCLTNQAAATDSNGLMNSASSQFCVQKSILGASQPQVFSAPVVVKTPATGPEMLPLFALLPGGLAGFILRKKSIKNGFKGGEK